MSEGSGTVELIGRGGEMSRLHRCLERASRGEPMVVMVEGPAGIGKSALVDDFVRRFVDDGRVLAAAGDEFERDLAYGVIGLLLHQPNESVLPFLTGITPSDRVRVGLLMLERLLDADVPTVIVVDDAQWVDDASLRAIRFALRRLHHDAVLTILIVRSGEFPVDGPIARTRTDPATVRIEVSPLTLREVEQLVAARIGRPIGRTLARRLRAYSGGNPLHLLALVEHAASSALPELVADQLLPAPTAFSDAVLSSFARCSARTRALAETVAVLGWRASLEETRPLIGQWSDESVAEAVENGLLAYGPGDTSGYTLTFPHPMIRAAIYQGIDPGRRRALHLQAARLTADPLRALHHKQLAATGPDSALAHEFRAAGAAALGNGAADVAAEVYAAASRLEPTSDLRESDIAEAVFCYLIANDPAAALRWLPVLESGLNPVRSLWLRGVRELLIGNPTTSEAILRQAWALAGDEQLRARVAVQLGVICINSGRASEAEGFARATVDLPHSATASFIGPYSLVQIAATLAGHRETANEFAAFAEGPPDLMGRDSRWIDALVGRGVVRKWMDDLVGAQRDLQLAAESLRAGGGPLSLGFLALVHLAEAEFRAGAWDSAVKTGEAVCSVLDDDGSAILLSAVAHATAALPLAARGSFEHAERHLRLAHSFAMSSGTPEGSLWAGVASAYMGHAQGDWPRVVAALSPVAGLSDIEGLDEPGVQPWRTLLAEALIRVERADEADDVLQVAEAMARLRAHRTAVASTSRVRGLLEGSRGNWEVAEQAFEAASRASTMSPNPFERALVELARGAFERRRRRRSRAAALLTSARTTLLALGAAPYVSHAESELAACGLGTRPLASRPNANLTPREAAVAHLVAQGRSNREVADELFVTAKTVEYHLSNVYVKFGVRSRTELASAMRAGTPPLR